MAEQASENTCVVCFKNVLYYSIGECDHPVCFECSTRMRVLCLQNECPICRQDLSRVVFTETIKPYKELRNIAFSDRLFERQFKIGFCNEEIKQAYERLLENQCSICDKSPPFRTFSMLSDHMRKVHEKHYCDLCVEHLRIFTSERKCYTRQELAHHRRKGDLDDTSHRGHPLCEFCEKRFMDADELYRHLRKEHLYCHLCDADGKNLYYASHGALAHHFRTDHYLCEEGECAGQHLTAVFRSEIDLKAHKATVHGRGMNRGAARQARTLELQFNITPHPVVTQRTPRDVRERQQQERAPSPPPAAPPAPRIDTHSDEQFPRLSSAPPPAHTLVAAHPPSSINYRGESGLARTEKNFPALDGNSGPSKPLAQTQRSSAPVAATILRNAKPGVSIQVHSQPASASNFRLTSTSGNRITIPQPKAYHRQLSDEDFPELSHNTPRDDHPSIGAGTTQPSKVTMINSQEMQSLKSSQSSTQQKKPQLSSEAFPALSTTSAPAAPPQWINVSKGNNKKQAKTRAEPPPPRDPTFNAAADFPTLPVNKSKPKKQPNPAPVQSKPQISFASTPKPQISMAPTPPDNKNKKEKKKQNGKKENIAEVPLVNGIDKKYSRDPSFNEVNLNNNNTELDRKIKTVDTTAVNSEKNRNSGNGDFSLASKDYPPLNPKSANAKPEPPPVVPCYANANKKLSNGAAEAKAPAKARPACDGMTFTNSAGQTFPAPLHNYIPPPDFERRNRELVKKFTVALGSSEAVEDFKVASRAYRDSIISADEFYEHCKAAMGSKLDDVFADLVALLPDIGKQQELVVGRGISNLSVCSTCGQVVAASDTIVHDTAHWPPLSASR